jgi:hypothetical protein
MFHGPVTWSGLPSVTDECRKGLSNDAGARFANTDLADPDQGLLLGLKEELILPVQAYW